MKLRPLYQFIYLFSLLASVFFASSCSEEDKIISDPPLTDTLDQYLVDARWLASFTPEQIKILAGLEGYEKYTDMVEYGIDIYKISYKTTYRDQTITASGLVTVPQNVQQKAPLLAGLHGTLTKFNEAPSNVDNPDSRTGLEIFSALGFITAIPDYIGFGDSKEAFHPYYDYLHSGRTVVDMLYAVKEFLTREKMLFRNDLFITGYSEGGYTSLATLKYIEENNLDFHVKATASGAGGYDIASLMQNIIDDNQYERSAYLVYVVYAYNLTNQWQRPLTDFFQEPYASEIPAYFDGTLSISQINEKLPKNLDQFFNPAFLQGIKDSTETQFLEAVRQNSINNWTPQSYVRLYHAQDDEIIPIANTEATYNTMIANGAPHTSFFPMDEATSHNSGTAVMYKMVVPWFLSLKGN